jgi:hypothetical protein
MILGLTVSLIVLVLGVVDWVYLRKKHQRALLLELFAFGVVIVLAVRPRWFSALAASVGIGRGVDLIIYPVLVWLFREAVLGRVRYYRQRAELTQIVRHLAISSRLELNSNLR